MYSLHSTLNEWIANILDICQIFKTFGGSQS